MSEMNVLLGRLCRISASESGAPRAAWEWPARIGADEWCMSPELLSLHGTPFYDALDEDADASGLARAVSKRP